MGGINFHGRERWDLKKKEKHIFQRKRKERKPRQVGWKTQRVGCC